MPIFCLTQTNFERIFHGTWKILTNVIWSLEKLTEAAIFIFHKKICMNHGKSSMCTFHNLREIKFLFNQVKKFLWSLKGLIWNFHVHHEASRQDKSRSTPAKPAVNRCLKKRHPKSQNRTEILQFPLKNTCFVEFWKLASTIATEELNYWGSFLIFLSNAPPLLH